MKGETNMFSRVSTMLSTTIVFAGLVLGNLAAGKPPRPPAEQVDKGNIYFGCFASSSSGVLMRMLPDGTQKTEVMATVTRAQSTRLHAGLQWHLVFGNIAGETYPDEKPRYELFALSETGTSVQLTDDPSVAPFYDPWWNGTHPRWANDGAVADGKVSFNGYRWVDGAIAERGIFAASFDPDALGDGFVPVALTLQPVSVQIAPYDGGLFAFGSYDWSPDGSAVVFAADSLPDCGLRVQSLGGPLSVLTTDRGTYPRWSNVRSDGESLIAFYNGAVGIEVIKPDGTGRRTLVAGTNTRGFSKELRWSPSGTYLACGFVTYSSRGIVTSDTVYRIPYSGGTGIALTKDLTWCEPRGWPQGE
jgi:hypothetical protein